MDLLNFALTEGYNDRNFFFNVGISSYDVQMCTPVLLIHRCSVYMPLQYINPMPPRTCIVILFCKMIIYRHHIGNLMSTGKLFS